MADSMYYRPVLKSLAGRWYTVRDISIGGAVLSFSFLPLMVLAVIPSAASIVVAALFSIGFLLIGVAVVANRKIRTHVPMAQAKN